MGTNSKIARMITSSDLFAHKLRSLCVKDNSFFPPFFKQLENDLEETLKSYDIDKLTDVIATNQVLKSWWSEINTADKENMLRELDALALRELEFDEHVAKFDKLNFVFLFNDNSHAVYVNGLNYFSISEDDRRNVFRFYDSMVDKKSAVVIQNNEQLENYYAKNQAFPKWLKDLEFLNIPEFHTNRFSSSRNDCK